MEQTAQTEEPQPTQPQKPIKPTSIKILQWVYPLAGLSSLFPLIYPILTHFSPKKIPNNNVGIFYFPESSPPYSQASIATILVMGLIICAPFLLLAFLLFIYKKWSLVFFEVINLVITLILVFLFLIFQIKTLVFKPGEFTLNYLLALIILLAVIIVNTISLKLVYKYLVNWDKIH